MDKLQLVNIEESDHGNSGRRVLTFSFTGSQPHAAFAGSTMKLIVEPSESGWIGSMVLQLAADGFTPVGGFSSEDEAQQKMLSGAVTILENADQIVESGNYWV